MRTENTLSEQPRGRQVWAEAETARGAAAGERGWVRASRPPPGASPGCCPVHKSSRAGPQPRSPIYTLSAAVFSAEQQSWVAVTETVWPTKPKKRTNWPYSESTCRPLARTPEGPLEPGRASEVLPEGWGSNGPRRRAWGRDGSREAS